MYVYLVLKEQFHIPILSLQNIIFVKTSSAVQNCLVSYIFFVEISTALSGLAFYVIVYLDMIGHKNSHLASVTFQVLALEMKVPLVWDMWCCSAQSVQIANPKHVLEVFRMSWKKKDLKVASSAH